MTYRFNISLSSTSNPCAQIEIVMVWAQGVVDEKGTLRWR